MHIRGHSVTRLSSGTPVVFEENARSEDSMMTNWSTETREILGSGFKSR